ncbi:MAG: tRNA lysidine(34) synthetase TilS [Alphaproteobacteria bacterium]
MTTPTVPGDATGPVQPEEFAAWMAAFAPFERAPSLAVAVSGGADSMALCLVADAWAQARAGRTVALTVDHGLRPASAAEARQVGRWLKGRGIRHKVLRWQGPKPATRVQEAAREARYRLLIEACREEGLLHLLLGHHRDDQAETFLLRLARGSGLDGLAAMAPLVETRGVRLLRPLLAAPKARLSTTLKAWGQPWVEDPSNRDPAFARVRLRRTLAGLAPHGLTARRLALSAAELGRARAAVEREVAVLLAAAATVHPAGYCRLGPDPLREAAGEVAWRALVRVLLCVGGGVYPPRRERLDRLHAALRTSELGTGRTLAGCRIVPERGAILVCREAVAAGSEVPLAGAAPARWDGRFVVRASGFTPAPRLTVRRLGRAGWAAVALSSPDLRKRPIPAAVRPTLPALWDLEGVVAVPHLGFRRSDLSDHFVTEVFFCPSHPLAPPEFAYQ